MSRPSKALPPIQPSTIKQRLANIDQAMFNEGKLLSEQHVKLIIGIVSADTSLNASQKKEELQRWFLNVLIKESEVSKVIGKNIRLEVDLKKFFMANKSASEIDAEYLRAQEFLSKGTSSAGKSLNKKVVKVCALLDREIRSPSQPLPGPHYKLNDVLKSQSNQPSQSLQDHRLNLQLDILKTLLPEKTLIDLKRRSGNYVKHVDELFQTEVKKLDEKSPAIFDKYYEAMAKTVCQALQEGTNTKEALAASLTFLTEWANRPSLNKSGIGFLQKKTATGVQEFRHLDIESTTTKMGKDDHTTFKKIDFQQLSEKKLSEKVEQAAKINDGIRSRSGIRTDATKKFNTAVDKVMAEAELAVMRLTSASETPKKG